MEGQKFDSDKPQWHLVQPLSMQEYIKVLTYGAEKYASDNWRKVPDGKKRYFSALLRHVWAWWLGEVRDQESGYHHLAHAMCCLAFLLEPELEAEAQMVAAWPVNQAKPTKEVPRGKTK
jgi:hypothetical protein